MSKVSIIVPNFNHARFLKRRLRSIFEQTVQDFELIFLDDASTDNSLKVFQEFADDPRVTSVVSEINSGNPFTQWNKGFDLASGQYIWIAESDDFSDPAFLEEMIGALESNPTAGLATSLSYLVDEDDRNLGVFGVYHWFEDRERWQRGYFNRGIAEIEDYLALQNTIPNASATLINRKLCEPFPRAPEDMTLAGDWFYWVRLLKNVDICHVGKPLNYFRQIHESSQRARTAHGGGEVYESFAVYALVIESPRIDERKKLRVQFGLLRRWLSVASKYRLGFKEHSKIFAWFLKAGFQSVPLKAIQVMSASLMYLVMPLTLVPGFKKFATWGRDLVTRSGKTEGKA